MRLWTRLIGLFTVLAILAAPARAHLMVAQHGTLNFVDNAAFMVASIPISAFADIDEDADGDVTMYEFNRNREAVLSALKDSIFLTDGEGRLELQGILLSPVTQHDRSPHLITDLTVMGRFNLRDEASALSFENRLYGDKASQQTMNMSATRRTDGYNTEFVLTPANPARVFFLNTSQGSSLAQSAMVPFAL